MARSKPSQQLSQAEIESFLVAAEALHRSIVKPYIWPNCEHCRATRVLHKVLLKAVRDITGKEVAFNPVEHHRAGSASYGRVAVHQGTSVSIELLLICLYRRPSGRRPRPATTRHRPNVPPTAKRAGSFATRARAFIPTRGSNDRHTGDDLRRERLRKALLVHSLDHEGQGQGRGDGERDRRQGADRGAHAEAEKQR